MLSRFSLALLTLLSTALLAFAWALVLFYHSPPIRPDSVDWPLALRDLTLSLVAFLLFATAAYLPVRKPVATKLTAGFGLNFIGVWQILLNDLLRPDNWLAEAIGLVCVPLGLLVATLGLYQMGRAYRMNRLILGSYQKVERDLATVDQLTQLYNRRYFFATCAPLFREAVARGQQPIVIGFRIMNLTELNQILGLSAGDELLTRVGRAVRRYLRPGQIGARMGGRRFAIFLPDASRAEADNLAHQIRSRLAHTLITDEQGEERLVQMQVTHRVGVAEPGDTLEQLTRRVGSHSQDSGDDS